MFRWMKQELVKEDVMRTSRIPIMVAIVALALLPVTGAVAQEDL